MDIRVGFLDVLLIVFVILKLCGVITWSWVWVLSPLWISLIIIFIVVVIRTINITNIRR